MLRLLRIGNVRDSRLHHLDGINREVYQVQILGASQGNNLIHGVLSNNPPHGMRKTLLNNNRPQGGELKTLLHNNKHLAGDKILLNNRPQGGELKIQLRNSLFRNNLPHGMRKILHNNRPQGGELKIHLRNSLLHGVRQGQQILGESNNGTHPLRLIHGHSREFRHGASRVTNLPLQQRMGVVAVQVNRGHNLHR